MNFNPPKEWPDIDEAAKFLLIGMVLDGQPKSITLSNDTILEYWPPKAEVRQHVLNLKIYGRNRGLGTRQNAIAHNAILAVLAFFDAGERYIDYGVQNELHAEWKCSSFGWELPA